MQNALNRTQKNAFHAAPAMQTFDTSKGSQQKELIDTDGDAEDMESLEKGLAGLTM